MDPWGTTVTGLSGEGIEEGLGIERTVCFNASVPPVLKEEIAEL
jgi:hypothetical protein